MKSVMLFLQRIRLVKVISNKKNLAEAVLWACSQQLAAPIVPKNKQIIV